MLILEYRMKKLFEILLVAVIFFSLGMYVGQDKDTADTPVVITDTPIVDTDTTTAVKVPELKPKSKLKPAVVKSKNLAVIYTFDEDIETEYNEFTETKVQTIGFALTDPHKRVNDHYKEKYGSTKLDFLSFQSIVNDEKIKSLLNIDPRIAAFSPFNLLGYKKLNEKQTYVMHLMPEVILDIIGIDALQDNRGGDHRSFLTSKDKEELKHIIINTYPIVFKGWDGKIIVDLIQLKYEVTYTRAGVYALMKSLGITHKLATKIDPKKCRE